MEHDQLNKVASACARVLLSRTQPGLTKEAISRMAWLQSFLNRHSRILKQNYAGGLGDWNEVIRPIEKARMENLPDMKKMVQRAFRAPVTHKVVGVEPGSAVSLNEINAVNAMLTGRTPGDGAVRALRRIMNTNNYDTRWRTLYDTGEPGTISELLNEAQPILRPKTPNLFR